MAPSFFSWLGNGTSRRALPVEVSGGPSGCAGCRAVADLVAEEEMKAEEPARSGRSAVEGLAILIVSDGGKDSVRMRECELIPRNASATFDLPEESIMMTGEVSREENEFVKVAAKGNKGCQW